MSPTLRRPGGTRPGDKPLVTLDQIVRTATDLTSQVGLSAWSLRSLATKLAVTPAAIYWHVADRLALETLVVDGVLATIDLPGESAEPVDALRSLAFTTFDTLTAHPGTAQHMATYGPSFDGALAIANNSIGHLRRAGLNPRQSAETHSVVTSLVLAAADSAGARRLLEVDTTEPVAFRAAFEQLDATRYPHLAEVSHAYLNVAGRRSQLEVGLSLLLTGAGLESEEQP